MPKAYWIAQVDIREPDAYAAYTEANAVAFSKFGGRFLVRGGAAEPVEGVFRARIVVIEFADYATALACYRSPEYTEALVIRQAHSLADVVVIEGYDGPQPGHPMVPDAAWR